MSIRKDIESRALAFAKKLKEREEREGLPREGFLPKFEPLKVSLGKKHGKTEWQPSDWEHFPLTQGQFGARPKILDELVVRLNRISSGAGRALDAVLTDLAMHTNGNDYDVLVSNSGIAWRRRVSPSSVKAALRWLREINVLRRGQPTPARAAELKRRFGDAYSSKTRYLVWNNQSDWRVPTTDEGARVFVDIWEKYTGAKKKTQPKLGVVQ